MSNFKEKYLKENIDISVIDDFIDEWHTNPKGTLQEFLGLSNEEFQAYTHSEKKLKKLLDEEKKKKDHKTASKLRKVLNQLAND